MARAFALMAALNVVLALHAAPAGYVLSIGIRSYAHLPRSQSLEFADVDAQAFADFWRSAAGGAVPAANVHVIANEQATRTAIGAQLNWLREAGPDDVVYVFFAGHGAVDNEIGLAYLLPYDTDASEPSAVGYRADDFIRDLLQRTQARHVVVFIDACHAGAALQNEWGRRSDEPNITTAFRNTWSQLVGREKPSFVAFLSATSTQLAWEHESLKHGVFTHFVLQGLRGAADTPPYGNGDGIVRAGELYEYLRTNVPRYTQEHHKTAQTPVVSPNYNDQLPLTVVGHGIVTADITRNDAASGVDAYFPLLPDHRGAPGEPRGEAATALEKSRKALEERDLFCGRDPTGDVTLFETRLQAYRDADHSVKLQLTPWGQFYRGVALARLQAYPDALRDLRDAQEAFDDLKAADLSARVSRVKELIGRRRASGPLAPGSLGPACTVQASRTICDIAVRATDRWTLTGNEAVETADLIERVVATPCALPSCIAIAPSNELDCGRTLADRIGNPDVSARVYQTLLRAALDRGLSPDAAGFARLRYSRLCLAGKRADALALAAEHGRLWSASDLAALALVEAFDPQIDEAAFASSPILARLEPLTRAAAVDVRRAAFEQRTALTAVNRALTDAAASMDDDGGQLKAALATDAMTIAPKGLRRLLGDESVSTAELAGATERLVGVLRNYGQLASGPLDLPTLLGTAGRIAHMPIDAVTYGDQEVAQGYEADLERLVHAVAIDFALRSDRACQMLLIYRDDVTSAVFRSYPAVIAVVDSGLQLNEMPVAAVLPALLGDSESSANHDDALLQMIERLQKCFRLRDTEAEAEDCLVDTAWLGIEGMRSIGMLAAVIDAHDAARTHVPAAIGEPGKVSKHVIAQHFWGMQLELEKLLATGRYTDSQRFMGLCAYLIIATLHAQSAGNDSIHLPGDPSDSADAQLTADELRTTFQLYWRAYGRNERSPALGRDARDALARLKYPLLRAMVLALPQTYAGLDPIQVRSLLRLVGIDAAHEPGELRLAHFGLLAAMTANDAQAHVLTYAQISEIANFLPDAPVWAVYSFMLPVEPSFYSIAEHITPTSQFSVTAPCAKHDVMVGFGGKNRPVILIESRCLNLAVSKWELLVSRAAAEGRMEDVARYLERLEQQEGLIGAKKDTILVPLLKHAETMPTDLKLRIVRDAVTTKDQDHAFPAVGEALITAVESGVPIAEVLPYIENLAAVAETAPLDSDTIHDWLEYLDESRLRVRRIASPQLIAAWSRTRRSIRGHLAAPNATERSAAKAILKQFEESVKGGDIRRMTDLGAIFAMSSDGDRMTRGRQLLRQAAAQRDAEAMHLLGVALLETGDCREAERWLRQAAANGNPDAAATWGRMLLSSRCGRSDTAKGLTLLRQSAAQHSAEAMYELAVAYLTGNGVSQSPEIAEAWLRDAIAHGHAAAEELLRGISH